MFQSATIKLTAWYLSIIMLISISFSILIFSIASHELDFRLERFQNTLNDRYRFPPPINDRVLRSQESSEADSSLISQLVMVNLAILVVAGGVSYLLAKKTIKPIQRSHEAQSRFTSDASHELRTPLATMKTEIEVALHDKNATKAELSNVMMSNLEEINSLSRLVENLLSMSTLENSTLKFSKMNLNNTVDRVVKKLKLSNSRIEANYEFDANINGNADSVDSLISILLDNAIKYSPADSKVSINIKPVGDKAQFSISNTGEGIPESKLPYIFDRFYRAESSRNKTSKPGYGLGLAIAKQIVVIHNGAISVASEEGGITTFTIEIPICET